MKGEAYDFFIAFLIVLAIGAFIFSFEGLDSKADKEQFCRQNGMRYIGAGSFNECWATYGDTYTEREIIIIDGQIYWNEGD